MSCYILFYYYKHNISRRRILPFIGGNARKSYEVTEWLKVPQITSLGSNPKVTGPISIRPDHTAEKSLYIIEYKNGVQMYKARMSKASAAS